MAFLVKKYRLSVSFVGRNRENGEKKDIRVEIVVNDAPFLAPAEKRAIIEYFGYDFDHQEVEVLDSWHEMILE